MSSLNYTSQHHNLRCRTQREETFSIRYTFSGFPSASHVCILAQLHPQTGKSSSLSAERDLRIHSEHSQPALEPKPRLQNSTLSAQTATHFFLAAHLAGSSTAWPTTSQLKKKKKKTTQKGRMCYTFLRARRQSGCPKQRSTRHLHGGRAPLGRRALQARSPSTGLPQSTAGPGGAAGAEGAVPSRGCGGGGRGAGHGRDTDPPPSRQRSPFPGGLPRPRGVLWERR